MPGKGERTRAEIIRRSADLMNRQGFLAAPVSAVIAATGIQKGGLYRHFDSREALAFAAFDFAVASVRDRLLTAIGAHDNACDKLLALLDAYAGDELDAPLRGGCPIMNTAIEADHSNEALRGRARAAMDGWRALVAGIVEQGRARGEIRADARPHDVASTMIACIEGGVMLTQLYRDPAHLRAVRAHLQHMIANELWSGEGEPA